MLSVIANANASAGAGSVIGMVAWMVFLVGMFYFMLMRPQKKEQQRKTAMMSTLEVGDTVLTTSGFYGIIIDIADDTVIVEFGNNRNCRIPMQKDAISIVEKPEDATKADTAVEDKKKK